MPSIFDFLEMLPEPAKGLLPVGIAEFVLEFFERYHQVQDAVGSSETPMRVTKPVRKNSIFGNPVQNANRTDDRRVDCAGQHQRSNHSNKGAECQTQ